MIFMYGNSHLNILLPISVLEGLMIGTFMSYIKLTFFSTGAVVYSLFSKPLVCLYLQIYVYIQQSFPLCCSTLAYRNKLLSNFS